jgi:maltooligosyltrehalose trehalohydrolase
MFSRMKALQTAINLGATYLGEGRCRFLVWAPYAEELEVHLVSPREALFPLVKDERGYFSGEIEGVEPGCLYVYRLNGGQAFPDPVSRFQPRGVHGPSQVADPHFSWEDGAWCGIPLRDYVIYELHVGTFTVAGTFEAVIPHLDELKNLGITAVELMPVAQFPGSRNWGYDGVYPYAVQESYGGPEGLKNLVNACHQRGLAVVLDVVYNHLGPEGNYLANFGPYFTPRYCTPWGSAVNFDGPGSDEVRCYFIGNALAWITEYHIDSLRLDALHAIADMSPRTFLAELADAVHQTRERLNRQVFLMAESDRNDIRLLRAPELGGYGLDAHWNDDFHHALHALLTGEETGYYLDFGRTEQLAKAWREGFIYSGEYSSYRRRRHGSSSREVAATRWVVFAQNHDQVGNRLGGDRLGHLVSLEALKLAAGTVLLSPFIPLLFMGEEYGDPAPFLYFVSHGDPGLIEAVRRGRQEEFEAFNWAGDPPDPQAEETFARARLDRGLRQEGEHKALLEFYREALRVRRALTLLTDLGRQDRDVRSYEREKLLWVRMLGERGEAVLLAHFGRQELTLTLPWPEGSWRRRFDSADTMWQGPGSQAPPTIAAPELSLKLSPQSLVLYLREDSL